MIKLKILLHLYWTQTSRNLNMHFLNKKNYKTKFIFTNTNTRNINLKLNSLFASGQQTTCFYSNLHGARKSLQSKARCCVRDRTKQREEHFKTTICAYNAAISYALSHCSLFVFSSEGNTMKFFLKFWVMLCVFFSLNSRVLIVFESIK